MLDTEDGGQGEFRRHRGHNRRDHLRRVGLDEIAHGGKHPLCDLILVQESARRKFARQREPRLRLRGGRFSNAGAGGGLFFHSRQYAHTWRSGTRRWRRIAERMAICCNVDGRNDKFSSHLASLGQGKLKSRKIPDLLSSS